MASGDFVILRSPSAMRDFSLSLKVAGRVLVLVPTMGFLHAGHLSLLRVASEAGDEIIVSIYVNRAQFSAGEDFEIYPRDLACDLEILRNCGVRISAVYVPEDNFMYGSNFGTEISVPDLGGRLCGKSRVNYFGGVALVVAKLFHQTLVEVAVFGEKDYQQLAIIRRLVLDLDFGVEVLSAPIFRGDGGLALSSRNSYLSSASLVVASLLYEILCECGRLIVLGGDVCEILSDGRKKLLAGGFCRVDYLSLVYGWDLLEVDEYDTHNDVGGYRLLGAVYLDEVRLIDNIGLANLL